MCPTQGYFDWASSAPIDLKIAQNALLQAAKLYANPSSIHAQGTAAKNLLTEARRRCATALNVREGQIIFTSGGTEADFLPIASLLQKPQTAGKERGSIIISAIEHAAVREQAEVMKNCGWQVLTVYPDKRGIVGPEAVLAKLTANTALVCVIAVNNETGAVQPVYEIADALIKASAGKKRPKFHIDAVQAVGKINIQLSHAGIDSAAISAHKIRGPRGCGILYLKQRQDPFVRGGGQENGLRPGTENLYGALAMADCLENCMDSLDGRLLEQCGKTARFIDALRGIPSCLILPENRSAHSPVDQYSPWIVQAAFEKIPGQVLVRALSDKGFCISTGSACASRKISRPVLEAMGVTPDLANNAVRFSFGSEIPSEDYEGLIAALREICAIYK